MSAIRALRRRLQPLRRFSDYAQKRLLELPYLLRFPAVGSADWLVRTEVAYGGYVTNVDRRRVSPLDGRSPEQLAFGGMTGGDRMLHHGYGHTYARFLAPFLGKNNLTIAEFGILRGTGLAIWCDLFPSSRAIGLDIDLSHFYENRISLEERGAFKANSPELHTYDQLADGGAALKRILAGDKLDIVIDDGLHSRDSIVKTWRSVKPHLSPRFAYFIEDYESLLDECSQEFSGYDSTNSGFMTIISADVSTD